jgi:hypothetical protein
MKRVGDNSLFYFVPQILRKGIQMKKIFFALALLTFQLASLRVLADALPMPLPSPQPTPVAAPEARALEVRFFGGLTGFDDAAYRTVKSIVASLLSEGAIDQFKTSFWGREGGSSFCIELSPTTPIKIEQITQMLAAIHPKDNSVYKYTEVEKCQ